jgi:hypothetical protein
VRLTQAQSRKVLRADIARLEQAVKVHFPEYMNLNEPRRRVVLDMAFNLGFRALGFKAAIAAIKARNFSQASRELYKSKWAYQVGDGEGKKFDRCDRLSRMLLTGEDYTNRRSSRASEVKKVLAVSRVDLRGQQERPLPTLPGRQGVDGPRCSH